MLTITENRKIKRKKSQSITKAPRTKRCDRVLLPKQKIRWLNTSYKERNWIRRQHFTVTFVREPASITVKLKHYFISMDRAFSPIPYY